MTTLQIVAAVIAALLYLGILGVLMSVSKAVIHTVPRKPALPAPDEPKALTTEVAVDE